MDPEGEDALFDDEYTLETTALESAAEGLSARVDRLASPREPSGGPPPAEVIEMATLYQQMLLKKAAQMELMRKREAHVGLKHRAALRQRDQELEALRVCCGNRSQAPSLEMRGLLGRVRGLRAALSQLTATVRLNEGAVARDMETSLTAFLARVGRCVVVEDRQDEDAAGAVSSYQGQVEGLLLKLAPPPEEEEEEEEGAVEVATTAQHRADVVLASLRRMVTAKEQADWLAARERELAAAAKSPDDDDDDGVPPAAPLTFADAATETAPVSFFSSPRAGGSPAPLPRP